MLLTAYKIITAITNSNAVNCTQYEFSHSDDACAKAGN